jgi:uncharacterized protein YjbI with pentapeptide repeats
MATKAKQEDDRTLRKQRITRDLLHKLHRLHADFVAGRRSGKRAMLEGCDLRGLDFSHMNFRDSHFINCRFDESAGRSVCFANAALRGSSFDRADLTSADFQKADLRSVSFEEANVADACFDRSDMRQDIHSEGAASFKGAILTRANFAESKLKNADFSGALLAKTNLSNADLRGASFRNAEMKETQIGGAMLIDSDFSGAVLDKSMEGKIDMNVVKGPNFKKLDSARLEKILADHEAWILSLGKKGSRADFTAADLSGLDLSKRILALADFSGAKLAETKFDGAWLMAANFNGANMSRARLVEADLRGADFSAAHQRDIDVRDCRIGALPGLDLATRGLAA